MRISCILILLLLSSAYSAKSQNDTIFLKANQKIVCTQIKDSANQYHFLYHAGDTTILQGSILKVLVDTVKYSKFLGQGLLLPDSIRTKNKSIRTGDSIKVITKSVLPVINPAIDSTTIKPPNQETQQATDQSVKSENKKKSKAEKQAENSSGEKFWQFSFAYGINLGNILEFNNPAGPDKKNFTLNTSVDLALNYRNPNRKFGMTNEIHYLLGIQREGLTSGNYSQIIQDQLTTFHDFSVGLGKKNKFNVNLILKSTNAVFNQYDGYYFKDVNNLGLIQAFASPYNIIVSPGFKYQPSMFFRISVSPYSFQLYGVKNLEIANKGIYITEMDQAGKYKRFQFNRQGAEVNFWLDKQVKEWLTMQYRLSFSSDYITNFGKNGLMDGFFITKIRIVKNIYLTHQATIKSDLAVNFLSPHYNQMILVTFSKSF
jgi:hypothetical protein